MDRYLPFSRTLISLSLTALLALPGAATAEWASDTGADGANGTNGAAGNPGANGTDGGAGGNASAFANADDATNYATARGGNGGFGGNGGNGNAPGANGGNGGAGGRGGDASAGASLLTPGFVVSGDATAVVTAIAGNGNNGGDLGSASGGIPGSVGDSGDGGNARASGSTRGTGNVRVDVRATGGGGGVADYDNYSSGNPRAGNGGSATLGPVYGQSTGGGSVSVTGEAAGGGGGTGWGYGATAGNGASVDLVNVVDGDTSGQLTLIQNARGGAGGKANYGPSGQAGDARSVLDKTTASSALIMRTEASGGVGGYKNMGSPPATAATGGRAEARTRGVNTAGSVDVRAVAQGGNGGPGYNGHRGGQGGQALAVAEGAGAGNVNVRAIARGGQGGTTTYPYNNEPYAAGSHGGRAEATASATGLSGSADAIASSGGLTWTLDAAGTRYFVQSSATAPVNSTAPASSKARASAAMSEGMTDRALLADTQAAAFADLLPSAADATAALAGNAQVQAGLGANNALLLGLLGGAYSVADADGTANTYSSMIEFSMDMGVQAAGALRLGLLDPVFTGSHGFDSLGFRVVVENMVVSSETFTDLNLALDYFDDNLLDYGFWQDRISSDGMLDVRLYLDLTEQHLGEGFNTNFIAGVSAVPVPAAVWLFGSGLLMLAGLGRRRR